MSKIQVKAVTMFVHGRFNVMHGQELEMSKGEADDLIKAGLVQVVEGDKAQAEQPAIDAQLASAPAAEPQPGDVVIETGHDEDDVLGEKAAAPVENKMEPASANKQRTKK